MSDMFNDCRALTTIYCNYDWHRERTYSDYIFIGCSKLKGAVPFDKTKTGNTMANPTTGYFTRK